MIKSTTLLVVVGISLFLLSFSTTFGEPNATKEVTIKGQVIDPVCLITMNMKGEGHRGCALNCAKAGENLAIIDEKGRIYPILA